MNENMPKFLPEDYEKILEIVALIAWKIELEENRLRPKALKLAINTVIGVAENFAARPFEQQLTRDLKAFLDDLVNDFQKCEEFVRLHSVREKLRDVVRLFLTQAENRHVRAFSNFIYRFASRLSEVSGPSFAGMGRKLDASEAEILLEIRDELPR